MTPMEMTELELTGRIRTHVTDIDEPRCTLHRAAVQPFMDLRAAAALEGIDLIPVSGFRDYAAQLRIWNEKFKGARPLYDRDGQELRFAELAEDEILAAVLCWSAVPGASRHHWGSEIDIIDRAALPKDARVRLLPAEYEASGPFARLTQWLNLHMHHFGFFRPYATDRGGVHPEPWHLSYAPVSVPALQRLTMDLLRTTVLQSEIAGKALIVQQLPQIYRRFVAAVDQPQFLLTAENSGA